MCSHRLLAESAEFIAGSLTASQKMAEGSHNAQAAILVVTLLGQLFSAVSTAQPMHIDTGPDDTDDEVDITEDIVDSWLRTMGLVAGARSSGHADFAVALARCTWLQHLRPALEQLKADSQLDPRLKEALETLLCS